MINTECDTNLKPIDSSVQRYKNIHVYIKSWPKAITMIHILSDMTGSQVSSTSHLPSHLSCSCL